MAKGNLLVNWKFTRGLSVKFVLDLVKVEDIFPSLQAPDVEECPISIPW